MLRYVSKMLPLHRKEGSTFLVINHLAHFAREQGKNSKGHCVLKREASRRKRKCTGKPEIIKIITFNFVFLESSSRSLLRQVQGLRGTDALTETGLWVLSE